MSVQYLVIGMFFGLVTGLVGRAKGSSFLIWFVVGFILPAIGLVAAAMSRNERHDPVRRCSRCGRLLPIAAQVCLGCGEDLEFPDELLVPVSADCSNGRPADAPRKTS